MRARSGADLKLVAAKSAGGQIGADARLRDASERTVSSRSSRAAFDFDQVVGGRSIERIDFRFTNTLGQWCSFIAPIADLDLDGCEAAGGFPGRAIPWSPDVPALDPLVAPDFGSAFLDPFAATPTLMVVCNVHDSITRRSSAHDFRSVALRLEAFIESTHIGGSPRFTIEIAGVRAFGSRGDRSPGESGPDGEGGGRSAASGLSEAGVAYDIGGWDTGAILGALERAGVEIESWDAFVSGKPVSLAINADSVSLAADRLMFCKYVIDRLGRREGGASGLAADDIGIRVRQSVWRNGRPLFAGDGYAGSSSIMRHYAAGIVKHTPALLELLAAAQPVGPRVVATDRGPDASGGSHGEFIASDHVSLVLGSPKAMSVTFTCSGVPSNPYLAFSAIVLAGIDGFNYRMYNVHPFEPLEEFFERQAAKPDASSDADQEFLFAGDLLTPELLSAVVAGQQRDDGR